MAANGFVRNFEPLQFLGESQVDRINEGALRTLEETGVTVESPRGLEIMERGGCKVDAQTRRVRVPRQLALECLAQVPHSFTITPRDPDYAVHIDGKHTYFSLFAGMRAVNTDTWEVYTPTVQENHDACKVASMLDGVHASTSYTPYCEFVGVPPVMLLLTSCWSRMKYFTKISRIGAGGSHMWEIEMAKSIGVDIYAAFEFSPPLTMGCEAADCGIDSALAGYPVEVGCGGVPGGTHPATLAGSMVVAMAECMSGIVLIQLTKPGAAMWCNSFDIPQNMRTGAPAFGAIGISMFQAMWNQVWRQKYGIPTMNGGVGPSSSKAIDYQCGYERTAGILLSALTGASMINTVGGLTGELSYSPELSVLDNDLVGMIKRFLQGVDVSDETLALDLIAQVGPIPGFYLNTAHTRKHWKKEGFVPQAADWLTYPEWLEGGKKDALVLAKERAARLQAQYVHGLTPGQDEELDRILDDARQWYHRQGAI